MIYFYHEFTNDYLNKRLYSEQILLSMLSTSPFTINVDLINEQFTFKFEEFGDGITINTSKKVINEFLVPKKSIPQYLF